MTAISPSKIYPTLIFHVDVNSAFLSWSALKELEKNPGGTDLRTIPSAVAGDVETRHGIITAKSIPAKKYGIRTAEPVASALAKCPGLVLVKSDFATYRMYSRELMCILRKYSRSVQQVSIDEAYLDMSYLWDAENASAPALPDSVREAPEQTIPSQDKAVPSLPLRVADRIRKEVYKTLGFTVNVGISVNKLLAKTASDFTKPDQTHTLWPDEIPDKLWTMPIGSLHGCGHATAERLLSIGIVTIGDAARSDPAVLRSVLGNKAGSYIYNSANGRGGTRVNSEREDAKSYSNETTTAEDIGPDDFESQALPIIRKLSEKVAKRLARDSVYGQSLTVTVKTDRFRRRSHQVTLESSTNNPSVIYENARILAQRLLFEKNGPFARGEKIRLIGVGLSKLEHEENRQMSLFDNLPAIAETHIETAPPDPRAERLEAMVTKIKDRYGSDAIRRLGK